MGGWVCTMQVPLCADEGWGSRVGIDGGGGMVIQGEGEKYYVLRKNWLVGGQV